MAVNDTLILALGPLTYNWEADTVQGFYQRIARDSAYDRVYVGEPICAKRDKWHADYWQAIIDDLLEHGKEVVFTTLALITNHHELQSVTTIIQRYPELAVEINDLGSLQLLQGHPFHVGPLLNCYNEASVAFLGRRGARSIIMPVETTLPALQTLTAQGNTKIGAFVFGRLPLAISVRCYHARAHDLNKQHCAIICTGDNDGLDVHTLEQEALFTVNGLQTQSWRYANGLGDLDKLIQAGVGVLYCSPQYRVDMVAYSHWLSAVMIGDMQPAEAAGRFQVSHPGLVCANGYWHDQPGMARIETVSL